MPTGPLWEDKMVLRVFTDGTDGVHGKELCVADDTAAPLRRPKEEGPSVSARNKRLWRSRLVE
jgi:hypothetical protein